jgi:hypothetical protein
MSRPESENGSGAMGTPRLFPPPSTPLNTALADLGPLLEAVHPLRPKHRQALPGGIRRLSDWLTTSRDERPRDYLSRPENLAAYLHFFLPWNIYRQGRLLQGLGLDLPDGARIVDLGAGPLTFLLALWCARPDLRSRTLHYMAVDRSGPPLKAGEDLFAAMAPGSAWQVRTVRSIVGDRTPPADLLVLANFLNEIELGRGRDEDEDVFAPLLDRWAAASADSGRVLLIEPGTRPAARRLTALRRSALQRGWSVEAPCPHGGECPQSGQGRGPWCHFTFPPVGVPAWLAQLSHRSRLPKDRASLSFLVLRGPGQASPPRPDSESDVVRIVSEAFDLPDGGSGRYACTARGLALLTSDSRPDGPGPAPGEALRVTWPERPRRDAKSGALVVPAAHDVRPRAAAPAASRRRNATAPKRPGQGPKKTPRR